MRESSIISKRASLKNWRSHFLAVLVGMGVWFSGQETYAQSLTAENLFLQLPPTIFEYTVDSMTNDAVEELLERGFSDKWAVTLRRPDIVALHSLQDADSRIVIRQSAGKDGGFLLLGAWTSDACAAEIWQYDSQGHLFPYFGPEEPELADFLPAHTTLAEGVTFTYRWCLSDDASVIEAKALFWDDAGLVDVPHLARVFYTTDGGLFCKSVEPVQ